MVGFILVCFGDIKHAGGEGDEKENRCVVLVAVAVLLAINTDKHFLYARECVQGVWLSRRHMEKR